MNRGRAPLWALIASLVALPSVLGCSDCNLKITTGSLPAGVVGADYSERLKSDCGGDFWFLQEGNLPPGIGLDDNGKLRGTPTVVGTFVFTVGVGDNDTLELAFKGLSLVVNGS